MYVSTPVNTYVPKDSGGPAFFLQIVYCVFDPCEMCSQVYFDPCRDMYVYVLKNLVQRDCSLCVRSLKKHTGMYTLSSEDICGCMSLKTFPM